MTLRRFRGGVAVLATALLLATAGMAAAQADPGGVVAVQLSEYHFTPAALKLNHGQRYVLRVTNVGRRAHDLSAKAFFKAATVAPGDAAEVQGGEIEAAPGESVDVAFVAGEPGTYEMHCSHPLHSMLGMRGQIVVR